jgi:GNAT superfamily N-acetyltransferase
VSIMFKVAKLSFGQIGEAARLLARAFSVDPILTFFLSDPVRRKVAFPAFFRALIYETWEGGHVYGAMLDERLVGVCVWVPPDAAPPSRPLRRRAARNHLLVNACFPRRAAALYRGFEATLRLHPQDPHWYLFFIGVAPSVQRAGLGRKLMAPVLEIADREATLCYLETPFPATHEFYCRQGFDLGPGSNPFEGAPTLWTMVRVPKGPVTARDNTGT